MVQIIEPLIKVSDLMELLKRDAIDPEKLNFDNIVVAINGVDCSVLGGLDASTAAGDELTVVTVVHGGGTM
jgi:sulfur-carrier protein